MHSNVVGSVALGLLLCVSGSGAAQNAPSQVTVPFSDPSRPGTVKVSVLTGGVSVTVGSGRDVIVSTMPATQGSRDERDRQRGRDRNGSRSSSSDDPQSAGLRRLTKPAGLTIEEDRNEITISSPVLSGRVEIAIQVPAATSLVIRTVNGGDVTVDGVTGSAEVNNVNGSIHLSNMGGAVVAHATNGNVFATLRQVAADRPMSFTSFNGDVDVTLPAASRATLKLRSDRGDVYTDFDVQTTAAPNRSGDGATPSPAPRPGAGASGRESREQGRKDKATFRFDMDRSIYGTVNGGGAEFELRTFNGDVFLRQAK